MSLMEKKILIGTSGWGYDEWIGVFYPKSLRKEDYLSYYSQIFYTNEINTTFYNIPNPWVVKNWVKRTPEDFFFTAKLPQTITHDSKLDVDTCMDDLNIYLNVMQPLIDSGKLLAFLIQLPPSFKKREHFSNLREFISNWPDELKETNYHVAVEFRNKSWMSDDVFSYLSDQNLSYCAVIEPLLPPRMDVTNSKFAYIRFHGYGRKIWFNYCFNEAEIEKWAIQVKEVIQKAEKVGIYFNNHFSGYATKNSLMMINKLELSPRTNPNSVKLLDIQKKSGIVSKGQTSLDKFF